jgi:cell division protein FtsB
MSVRRNIIIGTALVGLIALMLWIVYGDNGLLELNRLREKEQAMAQRNETLARENVGLYRTILRLKSDPTYIESVARNELGMIGKEDLIIILPGSKERKK